MQNQKLIVTMKDLQRYKILQEVIEGRITGAGAAGVLGITPVHVCRLKKKVLQEGLEGLVRKLPIHPPNCKISDSDICKIIDLRKELYWDFNITHFTEKLEENHHILYSREAIRKILIKNKLHIARKKTKVHRMRRRMPKEGMLVQMDSSMHNWIETIEEKWFLIAMIDDATNEIPYARLFPVDSTYANMAVIRGFIERKGVFYALYADKASHFKTTRHQGLHYKVRGEYEDTQIERALGELGITLILANSPQAKGRIEVTFRLFQDRLIKEMRLAGIKDYEGANRYLEADFLPWYNQRFTHPAESVYMNLPKDINLDLIFSIKRERKVNNDNTISLYSQVIQIPPSALTRSFAGKKVDVCILEDRQIFVLYGTRVVARSILCKENKVLQNQKQTERIISKREYVMAGKGSNAIEHRSPYKPAADHPWKRFRFRRKLGVSNARLTF